MTLDSLVSTPRVGGSTGPRKTRVAVLFGGRSAEHRVSCASASSVLRHLNRDRYEVTPVRIDTDGVWTVGHDSLGAADAVRADRPPGDPPPRPVVLESMWTVLHQLGDTVDVVFPVLHGGYGEDGTLQSTLDLVGMPYVGNGVIASAVGIDKALTKRLLSACGMRVATGVVLSASDRTVSAADRARLGLPVFVKPVREGSSVGVSKVDNWNKLDEAIATARLTGATVLVEAAVRGREIDVGVLEYPDGRVVAGPPLEIRVPAGNAFFDFDAKYHSPQTVFDIPASLPAPVAALLKERAIEVFQLLGCSGLLRVDFFLPGSTGGGYAEPVVNEVNTMPGFTAASQYPRIFGAHGLDYPDLLDVLVDTALATAGAAAHSRVRRR
jgi:D-alanine-D-alanine ligase